MYSVLVPVYPSPVIPTQSYRAASSAETGTTVTLYFQDWTEPAQVRCVCLAGGCLGANPSVVHHRSFIEALCTAQRTRAHSRSVSSRLVFWSWRKMRQFRVHALICIGPNPGRRAKGFPIHRVCSCVNHSVLHLHSSGRRHPIKALSSPSGLLSHQWLSRCTVVPSLHSPSNPSVCSRTFQSASNSSGCPA